MNNTVDFAIKPWGPLHENKILSKYITVAITNEHIDKSVWRRFMDPVSIALNEYLNDYSCADVFWNSDGFAPYDAQDDAYIGFHIENPTNEYSYYTPLPLRATKAMWKLRKNGQNNFDQFKMRVPIPLLAL